MPRISFVNRVPLPIRDTRLMGLINVVQSCKACLEMEGRKRVLSLKNGTASAKVMFIAEAPGRNGADRTGVPLHGDPTGINFENLLLSVGWERKDVFVTNCVLCNPRDQEGNNRAPSDLELNNCSIHLESQIRIIDPVVVVTLGVKPLAATAMLEPHQLTIRADVAKPYRWLGRHLFPLYHPSPRAILHRNMVKQREDFQVLKQFVTEMIGVVSCPK